MMEFLQRHYSGKLNEKASDPVCGPVSLSPRRIGFTGTTISDYMIGVCSWISLQIGRKKLFPTKAKPQVYGPYKYLVYDDREDWPLYVAGKYRTDLKQQVQITWVGSLAPKPRAFWELFKPQPSTEIYEELKRLDTLWHAEPR